MKYKTIDELDKAIENRVKRIVKHYYTDWKNLDRPKYMKVKGSNDKGERRFTLITRNCGTYLITENDKKREFPAYLMEYYRNDETAKYYDVDLDRLTITLNKTA